MEKIVVYVDASETWDILEYGEIRVTGGAITLLFFSVRQDLISKLVPPLGVRGGSTQNSLFVCFLFE